ncbi:hypothetical protein HY486_04870 [Candidatus Woesearchaeota archaeon]|nr:hypothetical protein [Candidatus Woesearchaeota archaeon]
MNIWTELEKINVANKEKYATLFAELVQKVRKKQFDFSIAEKDNGDHKIIIEENRMNSAFIHIVPQEAYMLFKKMQKNAPQQFLGFSVDAGKHKEKAIHVSCFGIPCNLLAKSLLTKQSLLHDDT